MTGPKRRKAGSNGDAPIAIITGAGRGIGRATAEAFAAQGYAVVIAEIRGTLGKEAERALAKKQGFHAVFIPTDVADPVSAGRCVRSTLRRFGRVDCLVNNAGVIRVGPFGEMAVRDMARILDVNLRGPLLMSKAAVPAMLRQGSGSIINVASLLGRVGAGGYAAYCASKFGVMGFTEALSDELSGSGVNVWAVCPAMVDTMMARETGMSAAERRGALKPGQVAAAIVNLATGRKKIASGTGLDVT